MKDEDRVGVALGVQGQCTGELRCRGVLVGTLSQGEPAKVLPGEDTVGRPSGSIVVGDEQVGLCLGGDGVRLVNRAVDDSGRESCDRASRGLTPRSPLSTLVPVLVTAAPPRTAKASAVPRSTGA